LDGVAIDALFEQACALHARGALDGARALYQQILSRQPRHVLALEGLAGIAWDTGDPQEARRTAERALAIDPGALMVRLMLGRSLHALGRPGEAMQAFNQAIADLPTFGLARVCRGIVRWEQGEHLAALKDFNVGLAQDPEGGFLLSVQVTRWGSIGAWDNLPMLITFLERVAPLGALLNPFSMLLNSDRPDVLAVAARTYAQRRYPPRPSIRRPMERRPGPVRVGFVSGDFREHAVALTSVGYMEAFDRGRFELIGFSTGPDDGSEARRRSFAALDRVIEAAGEADEVIAGRIAEADIDVLIEFSGYTDKGRPNILAYRPSPVQVNFQVYPGTLGAPYIDYLIADHHTVREDETGFYSEKIVWMPDSYQPSAYADPSPRFVRRARPQGAPVVLACLNHTQKILPQIFRVWMSILRRTENSVLMLLSSDETARDNYRRYAAASGVDPTRLLFAERTGNRDAFLDLFGLTDLLLDTQPCGAHSTVGDAILTGTPMITCAGAAFQGRVAAGMLTVAGLGELVTHDLKAYEDRAVDLVGCPARLGALQTRISGEAAQSRLFDVALYTRHLEEAFMRMHERRMRGLSPESFAVGLTQNSADLTLPAGRPAMPEPAPPRRPRRAPRSEA
jgi:protein O-GlcNAc transferase